MIDRFGDLMQRMTIHPSPHHHAGCNQTKICGVSGGKCQNARRKSLLEKSELMKKRKKSPTIPNQENACKLMLKLKLHASERTPVRRKRKEHKMSKGQEVLAQVTECSIMTDSIELFPRQNPGQSPGKPLTLIECARPCRDVAATPSRPLSSSPHPCQA